MDKTPKAMLWTIRASIALMAAAIVYIDIKILMMMGP